MVSSANVPSSSDKVLDKTKIEFLIKIPLYTDQMKAPPTPQNIYLTPFVIHLPHLVPSNGRSTTIMLGRVGNGYNRPW